MTDSYRPNSDFLNDVIEGNVALDSSAFGQANLRLLFEAASSPERCDRDWAAFIISAVPMDTAEVRSTLLRLADDDDEDTRDEAIIGLARRDRGAAYKRLLPLLEADLGVTTLDAAEILADKRLLHLLYRIREWEGKSLTTRVRLEAAIAACETGASRDKWPNVGEEAYTSSNRRC